TFLFSCEKKNLFENLWTITTGGEGGTGGTGCFTSTSGSTSISTGIIAGNSSDWRDSSEASEDSSRGTSDSRSSDSDSFLPSPNLQKKSIV
ncbi:hypothetical protein DICPUDRAFT_156602, partial [Dictyostelium purpureum]